MSTRFWRVALPGLSAALVSIAQAGARFADDIVMSRGRPTGLLWESASALALAAA